MMPLQQLFGGILPQLVMFDLDGTLLDSVPDLTVAVDQMLARLGRPPAGEEQVRKWVGNGVEVLVRRALAGQLDADLVDQAEVAQALPWFMAAYSGSHVLTRVYPGVLPVLQWLQARSLPMALITNKPEQFVGPLLEEKGLGGFFRWTVGGDTLPQRKPDPAGLRHVLACAGVAAEAALFVGDSRNDVLAARAAGVRCVAMSYGYNHGQPVAEAHPDLVLDDLRQLLAG